MDCPSRVDTQGVGRGCAWRWRQSQGAIVGQGPRLWLWRLVADVPRHLSCKAGTQAQDVHPLSAHHIHNNRRVGCRTLEFCFPDALNQFEFLCLTSTNCSASRMSGWMWRLPLAARGTDTLTQQRLHYCVCYEFISNEIPKGHDRRICRYGDRRDVVFNLVVVVLGTQRPSITRPCTRTP